MSDLQIRALAVLQEALAFEGEELERFLDRRCAGDPDLRHEIEALLDHDSTLGDDFLETPILARFSDTDPLRRPPPPTPEWLGSYRVVGELGRGGMGSVYIGEQDEPVKRRVALKVARLADDEKVRARFRSECRALARLNHPNIAALYEIGTADDDYPFVALELVDGEAITTYCDRHGLDVRERLELYLGVCAGVQHAHEKGILHRDIKPSNVMVTEVDGRPTAKVIDFGIAYGLDEPLGTVTQDRQLVGSLAYISPEAAQHGKGELDTRSDVFSLGLLLYELLVGVLPYRLEGLSLFSRFTNDDLPRASVRLASFDDEKRLRLAEQRSVTPAMHLDTLRGDLDAILDQALMADRDQRYDSPSSLGRDLQSHLDARPISARPPSAAYVASRFIRRHVPLVTLALLLVVSMVVGTVLSVREARRAAEAAAQAEQARIEAEEVSRFLIELFEIGDPERNRDEPADVATLLDLGAERLRTELIEQPVTRARLLHTLGELATKLARYDQAERLIAEALELREDALDATHPDLFESINQLGVIYRLTGRLDDAEPLLRRSLAGRETLDDETEIATAANNLGNLLWNLDRFDEAEAMHRRALEIREAVLPEDHADLAESLNNLGVLLWDVGRLDEAAPIMARARDIYAVQLGEEHPNFGASVLNLGLIEQARFRYDDAAENFQRAVDVWTGIYGSTHPRTLMARVNLGVLLGRAERWSDALEVFQAAQDDIETLQPPADVQHAKLLVHLGEALVRNGRVEQGRERGRQGVDLIVELRGVETTITSSFRRIGAAVHLYLGEFVEAETIYRDVVRIRTSLQGADAIWTLRDRRDLAWAIARQPGREAEATALIDAVIVGYEATSPDGRELARALYVRAWLAERAKRYDTARDVLDRALVIQRRDLPSEHGERLDSEALLATMS